MADQAKDSMDKIIERNRKRAFATARAIGGMADEIRERAQRELLQEGSYMVRRAKDGYIILPKGTREKTIEAKESIPDLDHLLETAPRLAVEEAILNSALKLLEQVGTSNGDGHRTAA